MKYKRILFILVMSIICLVIYKEIVLLKYTYNVDLKSVVDKIDFNNKTSISNKKVSKYITYKSLKIENVFNKFTKVEDDALRFFDYGKDNFKSYISISKEKSYLDKYINGFNDITNSSIKNNLSYKIVNDNNITNDIELFKYLKNNYKFRNNLLNKNDDIKKAYYNKKFINNVLPSIEEFTIIEGDYNGYIIKSNNNWIQVYLCDGLNNYIITFGGKYDINDIYRLIGTIVINEEE